MLQMQSGDQDFRYVSSVHLAPARWCSHVFRFMGLNDLMTEIRQDPSVFLGDEPVENKVLDQVLLLVEDKISEVKNQAVKWRASCDFLNDVG